MSGQLAVGFDEQVFLAQRVGGVSRYVVDLIGAMRSGDELAAGAVLGWTWLPNEHAVAAQLARRLPTVPTGSALTPRNAWAYYLANARARRGLRRVDVLHHTYYHAAFLRSGFRGLRVTMVHDMIPELYPQLFERNPHLAKSRYIRESGLVLCNSEATRRDLVAVHGAVAAPIAVTPLAADARFRPGGAPVGALPARYVLFVGRRGEYKDFPVLAEAFAHCHDRGVGLVAVGGGSLTSDERALLRTLGIAERVRQLSASDADLPRIYANALLFVFPSRYEGFGLATLEAMACGTPTVLADTSSHPEVGGDAARYFPAGDVSELAAVLDELLGDDAQRATLSEAGLRRAAGFTWQRTAELTVAAYRAARG